jgi:hypothetical protein
MFSLHLDLSLNDPSFLFAIRWNYTLVKALQLTRNDYYANKNVLLINTSKSKKMNVKFLRNFYYYCETNSFFEYFV